MQTSQRGIAFLERHEGVVLRAYRCPAGHWTIGAGLTAASGVVTPKPGMVITRKEATRLLALALELNYEPAVRAAMPGASQHAFDGGVSFHFNTGAIGRASWVKRWKAGDRAGTRAKLGRWRKGGGRVLPGLVRRREEEADLILDGKYRDGQDSRAAPDLARIVLPLSEAEMAAMRTGFARLGFDPGSDASGILRSAVTSFQHAHDLTVDGIIGPATASTLQRMLDARDRAIAPLAAASAGGALGLGAVVDHAAAGAAGWLLVAGAVAGLLWMVWHYRDAIAAAVQSRAPQLAAYLRSL